MTITQQILRCDHDSLVALASKFADERGELLTACKLASIQMEPGIARAEVAIAIDRVENAMRKHAEEAA